MEGQNDLPTDLCAIRKILGQSDDQYISASPAQIYERYFKQVLRVGTNSDLWDGWRDLLETLAFWFSLNTGRRGVGLPKEPLIDHLSGRKENGQVVESIPSRLRRLYSFPIADNAPENELLKQLETTLLNKARRYRFAHDTFEEYFAASHIVSYFDRTEQWPNLDKWKASPEKEQEFLEVISFIREMIDESSARRILEMDIPSLWKDYLMSLAD